MKPILLSTFLALTSLVHGQNTWVQKAQFPGLPRLAPAGFTIGTKAYLGTGYNNPYDSVLRDFWEWDQTTNVWTKKADFGGVNRGWATGFSIGSKGYIGTGGDANSSILTDFWEYDPATNIWTEKASFAGTPPSETASFAIGSKGYILGRYNDFWEYDPATDAWTELASYPGCGIPVGFSIGNKGYLGTGQMGSSSTCNDFWEYDPAKDEWTKKSNYGGAARVAAVAFSIGGKGYIGTGIDDNNAKLKDFWEYDTATNVWDKKANFGGTSRLVAIGFAIGNKGYIGTGYDNSGNRTDFWEYSPTPANINTVKASLQLSVSPNPFISETTISLNKSMEDATLTVFNALGERVKMVEHLSGKEILLDRGNLTSGIYLININDKDHSISNIKIIIAD